MFNKFKQGLEDFGKQAQVGLQQAGNELNKVGAQIGAGAKAAGMGVESPVPKDLGKECEKAARILRAFCAVNEKEAVLQNIPAEVVAKAKGLAIMTVVKAGFIWSGKLGTGLVVARLPDGSWSAPSCIGTGGVGFGFQAGADITDFVIILNTDEAVQAFARGDNLHIGGSLSATAGPVGAGGSVQAAVTGAPMYSYSKSKGIFAGLSLDGSVILERRDATKNFYGSDIPAGDLLTGKVPQPDVARVLYDTIKGAEHGILTPLSSTEQAELEKTEAGLSAAAQGKPTDAYTAAVATETK